MPVFAQTCRRGPSEARAEDPVSNSIRISGYGAEYNEEDADSRYSKDSSLPDAVNSLVNSRQLQTSNIDKYLAATGQSGRHGYARTNRTIPVGTTNTTKTGYITDKGLFKSWATADLMNESSGKYGCPVVETGTAPQSLTGYAYPALRSNLYVGSAIHQTSEPTTSTPAIFVGSDMTRASDDLLPACGNEGMNVQVVYPGKATGFKYVGTYNIGAASSTGYELQNDIKNVTFQKCMERAEDKGMPLFSYTANKCYINKNSLSDATSAGLGIELKPAVTLPSNYPGGQKLLHFGKDGTLNVLNSATPTNVQTNIVYKYGLDTAAPGCDFKEGGVIMKIRGSWGLNCNDIEKIRTEEPKLLNDYTTKSWEKIVELGNIIKEKKAYDIRYEALPEEPVAPGYCDAVMGGRICGNNDGVFEEWLRRGGACPEYKCYDSRPNSECTTGCDYRKTNSIGCFWGGGPWKCANTTKERSENPQVDDKNDPIVGNHN
jgi:hypothetical protein